MKRTQIISFLILASFFLFPSVSHSQATTDEGQPSVLKEDQNPPHYVYDLKQLIKKSRENIKNVDLKIKEQAVIKRNQKREEKAREYYLQAMKLQEEGRLEEARQLFEKAIRITEHPEMRGYIKESPHRAKAQESALRKEEEDQERRLTEEERLELQRAEDEYQVAVSLYRQQKFQEAKTAFEAVEEMAPDYKAVRSYLQIIDQDIAQQDKVSLKEQKKEIERQQKEVEVARLREKELWHKEIEQKETDRVKQLRKQADGIYNEAIKLYQAKNYSAAKAKFQEVDWVVPDFKATRAYLGRIDQDIENEKRRMMSDREKELERQRWEETLTQRKADAEREKALQAKERERLAQIKDQAEFLYGAAVSLFDKDSFTQAKGKFDEVEALYPNYKLTRNYLSRLEQKLGLPPGEHAGADLESALAGKTPEEQKQIMEEAAARQVAEQEKFKKLSVQTEDSFNAAVGLYKSGRLVEAKEKFMAVDQMIPDYKSTRSYLKRIDDDIELLARTHKREQVLLDQRAEIERLKAMKEKADAMYAAAVAAFDTRDFVRAKTGFQEVEAFLPDFKKTKSYLQRIEEEVAKEQVERQRQEIAGQANTVYAQAVVLYTTGDFEGAKRKFIEVEALLPGFKDVSSYLERIDDDIIAQKEKDLAHLKELQVEGPYADAVGLYQNRDFEAAKVKFLEVVAIYPDYKDTAAFLNKIDDDIARQHKETELREKTELAEGFYQQAMNLYQTGDFVGAKDRLVQLEVVWPDYKDAPRYLGRIDGDIARQKKKEEQARLANEAEPVYLQALAFYKEQEFLEAKKNFLAVQLLCPGYRDTDVYLARIDKDIQNQAERVERFEQLRRADELYVQALNLYAQRNFAEAKVKLLETAEVDPNYKNLRNYLSRIDEDIRQDAAAKERQNQELLAEEPYAQAVALYHDRHFIDAKVKFQEAAKILPDYKKVRSYLSRIDQDIREDRKQTEKERVAKVVAWYREAQILQANNRLAEAYGKLSDVESIYPDYKNTRAWMEDLRAQLEAQGVLVAKPVLMQPADIMQTVEDNALEDRVLALYKEAVALYKAKNYTKAKLRFDEVAGLKPQYRSTDKYLQSIEEILGTRKLPEKPAEEAKVAATQPAEAKPAEARPAPATEKPVARPVTSAEPAKENAKQAEVEALYSEAEQLYKEGKYVEAGARFEKVEAVHPNYKASRKYIARAAKAAKKTTPTEELVARSEKDAEAVRLLAKRSEEIFRQIKELARDKDMTSALQTFSQVDRIISQMEAQQRRLEAQIAEQQRRDREEQQRQQESQKAAELVRQKKARLETEKLREAEQQKAAEEEQVRLADVKVQEKEKALQEQRALDLRVEQCYQRAVEAYRNQKYAEAREAFIELETVRPNYKDAARLLTRMDREQGEAELVARENADRQTVLDLVERASAINLEVVQLAESRSYDAVYRKFDELSGILQEIKNIKQRMLNRRQEFAVQWEKRMASSKKAGQAVKPPPQKFMADLDASIYANQARIVFREAEKLYSEQNYPEAKARFIEAGRLDPQLKAVGTYLKRISRIEDQRDFEAQKERNKRQARNWEKKEEAKKKPVGPETEAAKISAAERSKLLLENGIALFREQRYREARIKFEELGQIGNASQLKQAKRYLTLIENALQKEKEAAEREHQAERERFLREHRDRDRSTEPAEKRATDDAPSRGLTRGERELKIQMQQELRVIEQENQAERKVKVLSPDPVAQAAVEPVEKKGPAMVQAMPDKGQKTGTALKTEPAKELAGQKKVVAAKAKPVEPARVESHPVVVPEPKVTESPQPVPPPAVKDTGKRYANKKAAAQAVQRKEDRQAKARQRKVEARLRKELEQERAKLQQEKALIERSRRADMLERTAHTPRVPAPVEERKETKPEVKTVAARPAASPKIALSVQSPDDQEGTLRQAMEEEKRMLDQQREAIRRDFEIGVERLYNESIQLYKKRMYEEAQQGFGQVADMIKGYKKTDYYLGQIEKILRSQVQKSPAMAVPDLLRTGSDQGDVVSKESRTKVISSELDALEGQFRP